MPQMKCPNCGEYVNEGAKFCTQCGALIRQAAMQPEPVQPTPVQSESVQPTPVQSESVQPTPVQPEPVQPTPVQSESVQPAPVQSESVQPEPVQPTPAQYVPVQPVIPQSAMLQSAPVQQAPAQATPVKKGKKLTVGSVIASILLCLLFIVVGTVALSLLSVRLGLGKTAVESVTENLDIANLKLNVSGLSGDDTISDYIYDNLEPRFKQYIGSPDDIEEFLEEDFVKDFVSDKANDYISDILNDSGKGKIEVDEVMDFLRDHEDEFEDVMGSEYNFTDSDFDAVEDYLESEKVLDNISISGIIDENEDVESVFRVIRIAASSWLQGILWGLALLLIIIIFLVNRRFRRSMVYTGIGLFVVGGLEFAAGVGIGSLPGMINSILKETVNFGLKFYRELFAPTRVYCFVLGGIFVIAGILAIVLPQIFRRKKVTS